MKTIVLSTVLALSVAAHAETPAPPAPPPEVAKTVAAFAGKWTVDQTLTMPGQAQPLKMKEKLECKKVSGGRAVLCMESGTAPGMGTVEFTHLIAYDPERKQVHWFAVGSSGEVHDHPCAWKDDKTLRCDTLKATLGGQPISEEFTVTADGNKLLIKGTQSSKDGVMTFEVAGKRVAP